jgi:cyanoexosortase B-associated protein
MAQDHTRLSTDLPQRWVKTGLVIALTALAALTLLPVMGGGQWPWQTPAQVPHLERLQTLQHQGLLLPGWALTHHQKLMINQHDWTLSEYQPAQGQPRPEPTLPVQQIAVLMRPQPWHSNQPQVEWLDLNGAQDFRPTLQRQITLTVASSQPPVAATARFSRGHNQQHTFAMVQWYAWPSGGHPSPSVWFWVNQRSLFTRRALTPWVAVSLLIPINPLADINDYQPLAIALGSAIQQQLMATIFQPEG